MNVVCKNESGSKNMTKHLFSIEYVTYHGKIWTFSDIKCSIRYTDVRKFFTFRESLCVRFKYSSLHYEEKTQRITRRNQATKTYSRFCIIELRINILPLVHVFPTWQHLHLSSPDYLWKNSNIYFNVNLELVDNLNTIVLTLDTKVRCIRPSSCWRVEFMIAIFHRNEPSLAFVS